MKKITLLALIIAFIVSGCAEPLSNTQKGAGYGALIGAAAGALIGQAAGKNTRSTLTGAAIGAAVGAGTGAGIGSYMDKQEEDMRAAYASVEGVNIVRQGDVLFVTFRSDNQFNVGSFILTSAAQSDVAKLGNILTRYDETTVLISGHTDSTGSEALNQYLSVDRAGAVRNILLASGLTGNRVTVVGFGESRPIADNGTAFGRQINRRVEIKISPLQ
jgi:outer membrane protein OmpA-like peptidoglycan-associated protein